MQTPQANLPQETLPQETLKESLSENLKKVSLILFIILGLAHMISGFLMSSGQGLPLSFVINRIMAIPFAMTALIYGLSSIAASQKESQNKPLNIIFIVLSLLIFVGLVYINFFVADKVLI